MNHFVMGVLEELQEVCQSAMLLDSINISHLMLYARRVDEARANKKSRDAKRAGHLMEAPKRIGLRYKISLNLRSGVQIKSLPNSQELVVIGCLTLNIIREKGMINQRRSRLVESVVKSTMVSVFRGRITTLVVARVVIECEIDQT